MIKYKPLPTSLLQKKSFFLLSLAFNAAVPIALVLSNVKFHGFIIGSISFALACIMAIEVIVRPGLFKDVAALESRYKVQFCIGTFSMVLALILHRNTPGLYLLPLFFYKFYNDFYRSVKCSNLVKAGLVLLAVGVLGVPIHILLNPGHVSSPVFMIWLVAVSGLFLSIYIEEKNPTYSSEEDAFNIIQGIHYSTMSALHKSVACSLDSALNNMSTIHCTMGVPRKCANENIVNMIMIIDLYKDDVADLREIIKFVCQAHTELPVHVDGWSDCQVVTSKIALVTLLDFLFQISKASADANGVKYPYSWITVMPGKFVFKDRHGGYTGIQDNEPLAKLKEIITSDIYSKLFGLTIDLDCSETDPTGTGIKATITYG